MILNCLTYTDGGFKRLHPNSTLRHFPWAVVTNVMASGSSWYQGRKGRGLCIYFYVRLDKQIYIDMKTCETINVCQGVRVKLCENVCMVESMRYAKSWL